MVGEDRRAAVVNRQQLMRDDPVAAGAVQRRSRAAVVLLARLGMDALDQLQRLVLVAVGADLAHVGQLAETVFLGVRHILDFFGRGIAAVTVVAVDPFEPVHVLGQLVARDVPPPRFRVLLVPPIRLAVADDAVVLVGGEVRARERRQARMRRARRRRQADSARLRGGGSLGSRGCGERPASRRSAARLSERTGRFPARSAPTGQSSMAFACVRFPACGGREGNRRRNGRRSCLLADDSPSVIHDLPTVQEGRPSDGRGSPASGILPCPLGSGQPTLADAGCPAPKTTPCCTAGDLCGPCRRGN